MSPGGKDIVFLAARKPKIGPSDAFFLAAIRPSGKDQSQCQW